MMMARVRVCGAMRSIIILSPEISGATTVVGGRPHYSHFFKNNNHKLNVGIGGGLLQTTRQYSSSDDTEDDLLSSMPPPAPPSSVSISKTQHPRYRWVVAQKRAQKRMNASSSTTDSVSSSPSSLIPSIIPAASSSSCKRFKVSFQLFEDQKSQNTTTNADDDGDVDGEIQKRKTNNMNNSGNIRVLMRISNLVRDRNHILEESLVSFLHALVTQFDMQLVYMNKENEQDFSLEPLSLDEDQIKLGKSCTFVFDFPDYAQLLMLFDGFNERDLANELYIDRIPDFVVRALSMNQEQHQQQQQQQEPLKPSKSKSRSKKVQSQDSVDGWMTKIPDKIVSSLLPYQREGIEFGIQRQGRILLADEMGLGKTLQAIGLACYYREEWPLVIVCPSTLRQNWRNELVKWNAAQEDEILVVDSSSKMDLMPNYNVSIISYELLSRAEMKSFKPKVVIIDESHFVKSTMSKRTRATRPLIRNAKRAFLLSGTATPSRPIELYDQIRPLFNDKNLKFMNKQTFGTRYCDLQETPFGSDYSGASNLPELNLLLSRTIMIRRLKKHVLHRLRPKNRRLIFISRSYDDAENAKIQEEIAEANEEEHMLQLDFKTDLPQMIQYFQMTGRKKLPLVREYLRQKVFSRNDKEKFLIFAHHQDVLDGIERELMEFKEKVDDTVEYIRIDGNTPTQIRPDLADRFCHTPNCRFAVLSLTCAGTGLNFQTNCSNVIFCELFWTPGTLLQAEDRVHRIGSSLDATVDIRYLVCDNTLDDDIWPMLRRKLDIVGTTLDRHLSSAEERRTHFETQSEDEHI